MEGFLCAYVFPIRHVFVFYNLYKLRFLGETFHGGQFPINYQVNEKKPNRKNSKYENSK